MGMTRLPRVVLGRRPPRPVLRLTPAIPIPQAAVLVESPHAGRAARGLPRAIAALSEAGISLQERIPVAEIERLRPWIAQPPGARPLIVAAGGDGTVGAAADMVAGTDAVLGILPLGTSNDVARSLRVPLRVEEAAALLRTGTVATVDMGQFIAPGVPPRHFVHAATLGINATFARMATQVSVRQRRGRLTYLASAIDAWRRRAPIRCTLIVDGRAFTLDLLCLAVINAPVFGGRFGLRVSGSDVDDRLLDVLIIRDMPLWRLVLAAAPILLRAAAHVGGIRVLHARRLQVEGEGAIDITLDGEMAGRIPAEFALAGEALRVIVGPGFVDVDDPG